MANILACTADGASGEVINTACGESFTLLDLVKTVNEILGTTIESLFLKKAPGDVKHSQADIEKAHRILNFKVLCNFYEGLKKTVDYLT